MQACLKIFILNSIVSGIRSTHQDGWKDWVQWNDCDATCGGGTRFRFRNCKNVLDVSGCSGEKFQTETCSTQNCPSKIT